MIKRKTTRRPANRSSESTFAPNVTVTHRLAKRGEKMRTRTDPMIIRGNAKEKSAVTSRRKLESKRYK